MSIFEIVQEMQRLANEIKEEKARQKPFADILLDILGATDINKVIFNSKELKK